MASVSVSRPVPPGEERPHENLEVLVHVGEGLGEHPHDLVVDGPDDLVQLAAGPAHVLDLLLQEPVPLLERAELFEGERVDRSDRRQLLLHRGQPAGGVLALGELGARGTHGLLGLAPELASQRLDRRVAPHLGLGHLELEALGAPAQVVEARVGLGALLAQ